MTPDAITFQLREPVQAHKTINEKAWPWIKAQTFAGHEVVAEFRLKEDDRSVQQNKFYWGACLKEISEQARINGQKYTPEAWHELFKRQYLGYEIKKVTVAGSQRKKVIRRLRSTTDLKVRAMSKFLDQVQAFAATELGVHFSVSNWMEWGGVVIDPETGELIR